MEITTKPLFHVGEEVICVDALPGASVKNGLTYTVYSCVCMKNPANGLGPFCYVGVFGQGITTHNMVRAQIFRSIERIEQKDIWYESREIPVKHLHAGNKNQIIF